LQRIHRIQIQRLTKYITAQSVSTWYKIRMGTCTLSINSHKRPRNSACVFYLRPAIGSQWNGFFILSSSKIPKTLPYYIVKLRNAENNF
jgi:hypothetical protein